MANTEKPPKSLILEFIWYKQHNLHTVEYNSAWNKSPNSVIWCNTNEPEGYCYATLTQILYDLTCLWNLKNRTHRSRKQASELFEASRLGRWGWENNGWWSKGTKFSLGEEASTVPDGSCIPYGYQFKSRLLHFLSSTLLMVGKSSGRWLKYTGTCHYVGDLEEATGFSLP